MKITIEINEPLLETLLDKPKNTAIGEMMISSLMVPTLAKYYKDTGSKYSISRDEWKDLKGRLHDAIKVISITE
jgi:hypothetical protein